MTQILVCSWESLCLCLTLTNIFKSILRPKIIIFLFLKKPAGATWTYHQWWTQGHGGFRFRSSYILTWATQPGVISPRLVCVLTTPWFSWSSFFCSFYDVLSGSSLLQPSDSQETKCAMQRPAHWAPPARLNGLTAGPPPLASALLHQTKIFGLLMLVGLLHLHFPGDSELHHDHLLGRLWCWNHIWPECCPCSVVWELQFTSLGRPPAARRGLWLAAHVEALSPGLTMTFFKLLPSFLPLWPHWLLYFMFM